MPKSPTKILRTRSTYIQDIVNGVRAGSMFAGTQGVDTFFDPANGSDASGDGSMESPFAGLETAFAAATANQHDIVWYISGSSGNNLAAAMTWSKSYTHLFGICAPTRVAQRARIFQTSDLTGADPLLTILASGCIFSNFYIFQGVADATSLKNVSVTGGRNYFENVHFAGGGHATQAIDGGASLFLNGAEENTFVNCTVGVDTIAAATGMVGILADSQAHRNVFQDCMVTMYAGNTGAAFMEVADGTGLDRYTLFKSCDFINSNSDNFLMASGFVIPAYAANNSTRILLDANCMIHGTTTLDTSDRGVLYGNLSAITGADLSGVAVELKS
ncbi:hypothetical protein LCGC14_1485250 [marine sediment metagenome]|uniref:Uncharacterized protein n=1 Tax=marine sediment metagenome TaxID=412755 RepID=A0A0F9J903_9ZZZZ